jgi:membrane protein YqaA with SNARE-associated domain
MAPDYVNAELNKEAKRIDRWIAYIASRTWIRSGVFLVALLEATISPVLPELVVAAVLSYRKDISWKLLAFISALGSTAGAAILYVTGRYLYRAHEAFFDKFLGGTFGAYTERLLDHNAFLSMFLAAFTPLPDRIFAFLGGLLSLSFPVVVVAFFLGRIIRVGIVAYFSYRFGDEARQYILKHTKLVTAALILLIALYIFLRHVGIL